jgi:hypothetical protein
MSLVVNIPPEWNEKRIAALQKLIGNITASDSNVEIELRYGGITLPLIKPAQPAIGPLGALAEVDPIDLL